MSSGSFGLIKKDKTSSFMLEELQELIFENFIDYTTQYRIDFFFLYIKGSFKHTKTVYNHFSKILKDNFDLYKQDIYEYKLFRRKFYKRLLLKISNTNDEYNLNMTTNDHVFNIRNCLSKAVYFAKRLNIGMASPYECLFANVSTMELHLLESHELESYLQSPYICLNRK
jgi:hypothetical protein